MLCRCISHDYFIYFKCSYTPDCSSSGNYDTVQRWVDQVGNGTNYSCFYNQDKPWEVIKTRMFESDPTFHFIFWPCLIGFIFLMMVVVTFLQCGCRLVWQNCMTKDKF